MEKETEAMRVLSECIELMRTKANDYQNPNSNVVQADHYRRGIDTIFDTMNGKMLRVQSLLEASASGVTPKHESIEDSLKDLINYASFGVSWLRGKMEGQRTDRDMFNKPIKYKASDKALSPPQQGIPIIDKTEEWDFRKCKSPTIAQNEVSAMYASSEKDWV